MVVRQKQKKKLREKKRSIFDANDNRTLDGEEKLTMPEEAPVIQNTLPAYAPRGGFERDDDA